MNHPPIYIFARDDLDTTADIIMPVAMDGERMFTLIVIIRVIVGELN